MKKSSYQKLKDKNKKLIDDIRKLVDPDVSFIDREMTIARWRFMLDIERMVFAGGGKAESWKDLIGGDLDDLPEYVHIKDYNKAHGSIIYDFESDADDPKKYLINVQVPPVPNQDYHKEYYISADPISPDTFKRKPTSAVIDFIGEDISAYREALEFKIKNPKSKLNIHVNGRDIDDHLGYVRPPDDVVRAYAQGLYFASERNRKTKSLIHELFRKIKKIKQSAKNCCRNTRRSGSRIS